MDVAGAGGRWGTHGKVRPQTGLGGGAQRMAADAAAPPRAAVVGQRQRRGCGASARRGAARRGTAATHHRRNPPGGRGRRLEAAGPCRHRQWLGGWDVAGAGGWCGTYGIAPHPTGLGGGTGPQRTTSTQQRDGAAPPRAAVVGQLPSQPQRWRAATPRAWWSTVGTTPVKAVRLGAWCTPPRASMLGMGAAGAPPCKWYTSTVQCSAYNDTSGSRGAVARMVTMKTRPLSPAPPPPPL